MNRMQAMAYPPIHKFAMSLALVVMPAISQKPAPPPVDPQLPAKLKELKGFVKDRKMAQDFPAIGLIQHLSKGLEAKNPKDQSKICTALGDIFRTGKVRTGSKVVLYREAADALTKLEAGGAKQILKGAENKRFKDDIALRAYLTLALGKTKDPKQISYLIEITTRSRHDELRAASGQALGYFGDAKITKQREIVKEIIKAWGTLESKANEAVSLDPNGPQNFGPQNARKTLRVAAGKWISTLQKLTGVSQSKFRDWQRWQNKNKGWKPPK